VHQVYLGEQHHAELSLREVRAGYAKPWSSKTSQFELAGARRPGGIGRTSSARLRLLATIMGHTTFHAGSIEYQGKPIAGLPVYERCRLGVGLVPQTRDIFLPSRSRRTSPSPRAPAAGRWHASTISFPKLAERRGHWGNQISAANSRCSRSASADGQSDLAAHGRASRRLAPIIVEVLLQALQRLINEDSLAVVLVEQHAKVALGVTQSALVLNRGRIAYSGRARICLPIRSA